VLRQVLDFTDQHLSEHKNTSEYLGIGVIVLRKKHFRKSVPMVFVIVVVMLLVVSRLCTVASAMGIPMTGDTLDGQSWSMVEWWKEIQVAYNSFRSISLGLGTVSVALGAMNIMMNSDEKKQAQGKEQIKITIIAVAAIFLLPLFIQWGFELISGHQWDPGNP